MRSKFIHYLFIFLVISLISSPEFLRCLHYTLWRDCHGETSPSTHLISMARTTKSKLLYNTVNNVSTLSHGSINQMVSLSLYMKYISANVFLFLIKLISNLSSTCIVFDILVRIGPCWMFMGKVMMYCLCCQKEHCAVF